MHSDILEGSVIFEQPILMLIILCIFYRLHRTDKETANLLKKTGKSVSIATLQTMLQCEIKNNLLTDEAFS